MNATVNRHGLAPRRAVVSVAALLVALSPLSGCFEDDTVVSVSSQTDTSLGGGVDASLCALGDDCPCSVHADCASGLCVAHPDGTKRCARPCAGGCPAGFEKQEIEPSGGGSEAAAKVCVCVPTEVQSCLPSPETCDGEDNDCDGDTDEDLCDDGNPCTDNACDPELATDLADGCTATSLSGACDDGAPCTVGEVCSGGTCGGGAPKDCDDGNTCTADACDEQSGDCAHAAQQGPCDDGSGCTMGDACAGGVCLAGAATSCDDGEACTDDACDPDSGGCLFVANEAACDDADPCTQGDKCSMGACKPGKSPQCDDGNPCTVDVCDPALVTALSDGCTSTAAKVLCDDGDACTAGDGCVEGACVPGAPVDCDDGKPCTVDSCDKESGDCKHTVKPETDTCDDGSPCTTGDKCNHDAKCVGQAVDCDDGKLCTVDVCDENTGGCSHANNSGKACEDGDGCTLGDACVGGMCASGKAKLCDDGQPCTDDACDSATGGCVFTPNLAPCDDGDPCTLKDHCGGGKCLGTTPKICEDGNACTFGKCDVLSGDCVFVNHAKNVLCSDADLCTQGDACDAGVCKAGPALYCDDNNPCTDDTCDAKLGQCVHTPNTAACDDGNKCTTGDVCGAGQCKSGVNGCECTVDADCAGKEDGDLCNGVLFCDPLDSKCKVDTNTIVVCDKSKDTPCTKFACDKKKGQCVGVALQDGKPCDADGSICTNGDACAVGICKPGKPTSCQDLNPCTDDACDPTKGCSHTPNTVLCFDGDLCTVGSACKDGACGGGTQKSCDDGDPCTADACNKATGNCQYLPSSGAKCSDGNACTHGDVCEKGSCVPQSSTKCTDGNDCTLDTCAPKTGKCSSAPGPVGLGCEDGKKCTAGDTCVGGKCMSGAVVSCWDGNPCTAGKCDPASGDCAWTPTNEKGPCSDGDACTIDDLCEAGKCVKSDTKECDDKSVCTADVCNKITGQCEYKAVAGAIPCNDGDLCSAGDTCAAGKCVPKTFTQCDDGSVCTTDTCDPLTGKCVYTPVPNLPVVECSDDNACSWSWLYYKKTKKITDICINGVCKVEMHGCSDANVCTTDWCDPKKGCRHKQIGDVPCNDGNACTVNDSCKTGKCTGPGKKCVDGNPCTVDDRCHPKKGCYFPYNKDPCNDGNVCTLGDRCKTGKCKAGWVMNCDDGYDCTDDPCDPKKGCSNVNDDTNKCDDKKPCTAKEYCKAGVCLAGGETNCDDANGCTTDSCDPKKGCQHLDIGAWPCNDGNACTKVDVCKDKKCQSSGALDCDDKDQCTVDTCDPKSGCLHAPSTGPCDDGDKCSDGDTCVGGKCVSKASVNCQDDSICTVDTCSPKEGCVHLPVKAKSTAQMTIRSDIQVTTFTKLKEQPGAPAPADPLKAVVTWDKHASWTAAIPGAVWIWREAKVVAPQQTTEVGFLRAFAIPPSATKISGTFKVAGDDSYQCALNGKVLASGSGPGAPSKVASVDASAALKVGNNILKCMVVNPGKVGSTWQTNPAGLLFALEMAFDLDGQVCDDGNACTSLDVCEQGQCTGLNGTNCNDGDACTVDTCDAKAGCQHVAAADGSACEDGNGCTKGDACQGGKCVSGPGASCDDGNACTIDTCDLAAGCKHALVKNGQKQHFVTTSGKGTLAATQIKMVANKPVPVGGGQAASAWAGFKGWVTIPGAEWVWTEKLVSKPEQDTTGYFFRWFEVPASAEAAGGTLEVAAADKVLCRLNGKLLVNTDKTAEGWHKVTVVPLGGALKTGQNALYCEVENAGKAGSTAYTNPAGLIYRVDASWYNKGAWTGCSDGNACTVGDLCADDGTCQPGPPTGCDDDNHCTDDACDPLKGCANVAADANTCNDGSVCTEGDHCAQGKCVAKTTLSCDDGNACTTDACDPAAGCFGEKVADGAACDDGDPCTIKGACAGGACKSGGGKDCDDDNACTDDICFPGKGCSSAPNDANNCDDGNYCTTGDLCKNGACLGKLTNLCDDGNACTKDACNAKQACVHTPMTGGVCEDGDACTLKDVCGGGECKAGGTKECVDSQQCTVDGCDAKTGKCTFGPLSDGDCDDGNLCTLNDKCKAGKCKAGTPPPCGDGNPCTLDNCDPKTGKCLHQLLDDGYACDDGNLCTLGAKCQGGSCVGLSKDCDDKQSCTLDTCDPATGKCGHQAHKDGSLCAGGGKCLKGVCTK